MNTIQRTLAAGAVGLGGLSAAAHAAPLPQLDVPYVPTPEEVVLAMLELAEVDADDLVYDLGSGDGRIVITAAQRFGARGVGVDLDPRRIAEARDNARRAGVEGQVEFIEGDLFEVDFSDATVLTLYLLPNLNLQLRPRILEELEPGTPVVSHAFDMGEWEPDQVLEVDQRRVYYWLVPAHVAGEWEWQEAGETYRLRLEQDFQQIEGQVEVAGRPLPLEQAVLQGRQLSFSYEHPDQGMRQVEATLEDQQLIGATLEDEIGGDDVPSWTAERDPLSVALNGLAR